MQGAAYAIDALSAALAALEGRTGCRGRAGYDLQAAAATLNDAAGTIAGTVRAAANGQTVRALA